MLIGDFLVVDAIEALPVPAEGQAAHARDSRDACFEQRASISRRRVIGARRAHLALTPGSIWFSTAAQNE
jgi:hypothetical protein